MATGAGEIALPVAADHPSFDGHFPGRPVLPGVVLVAEVMAAIENFTKAGPTDWVLSSAKFVRPAFPGQPLHLRHERLASGAIRFEVRGPDGVVATGSLAPGGASAAPA